MFGHFDSSTQTQAQMLTDVVTDIFALRASADSVPESALSPHITDDLLLELKKASCGYLKKYGCSYVTIDQSHLLQCVTGRKDI